MIYKNINPDKRSEIINGTVRVFTQLYRRENSYSYVCFHLEEGIDHSFPNEGISLFFGEQKRSPFINLDLNVIKRY